MRSVLFQENYIKLRIFAILLLIEFLLIKITLKSVICSNQFICKVLLRFIFLCFLTQLIPAFLLAQHDAGVVSIDSVKSTNCGNLNSNIYVRIKNFASVKQLDTVIIGWSVNSASQTSIQYNKAVKAGDTSASFKLGNISFSTGKYTIKVWTYKPNNSTDSNSGNDTFTYSVTVYDLPTPYLSGDSVVCRNTADYPYSTTSSSGSRYSWNVSGGTITSGASTNSIMVTWGHHGTGSISVTETNSNGCKETSGFKVIIQQRPKPVITGAKTICTGSYLKYKTNNVSGNVYKWSVTGGYIVSGQNTNSIDIEWGFTAGTGSISVTETNGLGCDTTITDSIIINPKSEANFNSTTACLGDTTFFYDNSISTSGTITSYLWKFPDGTTSTAKSPTKIFSQAGRYSVKQIIVNSYGCIDSNTNVVVVADKPVASFTSNVACLNNGVEFTNTTKNALYGTISYLWNFGDGNTSTTKNPKHIYAKTGKYLVTLTASSSIGCKDSISDSVTIFVSPVANFTFTSSCQDTAISFKNTSVVTADSITSYQWAFGNGKFSTQKSPLFKYDSGGVYNVKLIVTTANGCKDSVIKKVAVYANPKIDFTSGSGCTDYKNVVFTATGDTGNILEYYWKFDALNSSLVIRTKKPAYTYSYKGPGTYRISLTTKSKQGCEASFIKTISFYTKPESNFTFTQACLGDSTYFTNTSKISSGSLAGYKWIFPNGDTLSGKNIAYLFTKPDSQTVKLISISNNGCMDTVVKQFVVNDRPKAMFGASSACVGEDIRLTDSSYISKDKLATYFWDFGDGTTSADTIPVKAFSKPGIYGIKLVIKSGNGCLDSAVRNITISPKPQLAFSMNNACIKEYIKFNNNSKVTSGSIIKYVWLFGDGDTSTDISPSHFYDSAGTYKVALIATSNQGCSEYLDNYITIFPRSNPAFSMNDACANNIVSFSDKSSFNKGTISKYLWYFGDGDSSTLKDPTHLYKTTGKYKVILMVTTDKGCVDSISDSITIFPLPTADFEANNICLSDEASFTNKSLQATEWHWDFGDSTTSTSENPTHKYFSAGTYMVKLKVKNINRCEDSISKQIEVYDLPKSIFSVNNICVSDSFQLTDSSKGATSWFWDLGDGYTATLQHPKHKYDKAGKYTIYLTASNSNGCADIYNTQIEVYDLPKANFSAMDICITDSLRIMDSSQNAANYLWNFGDNTTSISSSPKHKYQSAGTYTITLLVSNSNGCKDSISHIIKVDSTCVWPGDANADKIVDNKDILALGLAYSDTGSRRTDTNTLWKGNIVKNWKGNFTNGANYKHADSDGNGVVNSSDTSAITRNYTKTHAKKQNTNRGKNTDPVLKIEIQNDSLKAGDTLLAYIILGENALPAKDAYGLAFSLNYNQEYFSSVSLDYSASWLGNNILGYTNNTNGLDIALTRTNKKNISGAGEIAELQMVLKKDAVFDSKFIDLQIVDNILISANENKISVQLETDSVKTYKAPNSIFTRYKTGAQEFKVYPNPFNSRTILEYELAKAGKVNIMLYDINGRAQTLMSTTQLASGKHQFILDADQYNISSGVYLLKLEIDGIPAHKRIVKLK